MLRIEKIPLNVPGGLHDEVWTFTLTKLIFLLVFVDVERLIFCTLKVHICIGVSGFSVL